MTNFKLDSSKIPREFHSVSEIFKNRAIVRLVGGAVRDLILGNKPSDLDFAIDIPPEKIIEIAQEKGVPYIPTGLQHGTVTLVINNKRFEVTTLRVDVKSTDGRHAEVAFTDDWEEDAARRDFTINALSMDDSGNVFDYFNGINDLQDGIVRFVGNADKRIQEDGLRIMRFFRFCGKISGIKHSSFYFDDLLAIKRNIDCLDNVSRERISNEFHKIIDTKDVSIWNEMKNYGLLSKLCIDFSDNIDSVAFNKLLSYPNYNFELVVAFGVKNKIGLRNIKKKMSFTRNENKLLDFLVNHRTMTVNEDNIIRLFYKENIRKDYIAVLAILNDATNNITNMITNETFHKMPITKTEIALSIDNKSLTTKIYNRFVENFIQSDYKITKEKLFDKLDHYRRNHDTGRANQQNNKAVD